MFLEDYLNNAMEYKNPKVGGWINELLGNAESLKISWSQKELIQALMTVTLRPNGRPAIPSVIVSMPKMKDMSTPQWVTTERGTTKAFVKT